MPITLAALDGGVEVQLGEPLGSRDRRSSKGLGLLLFGREDVIRACRPRARGRLSAAVGQSGEGVWYGLPEDGDTEL